MNSNKNPKISIISASYNHEKYIGNFIKSILNQTFKDFELIIIDDKSSDKNIKIAKSFKDSRIKIIKHKYNMGPSISINDGIRNSSGEYLSFIASDDEAYQNYLEKGIIFLEKNKKYDALCFQLEGIDENNNLLKDKELQKTLKFKNIKHSHLVKDMFVRGNMIPAPGEIIRKSAIKTIGFFNPALFQTQDYDFHIKTLLKHFIYVYQKPLIKYRQTTNGNNIDNHSQISKIRQELELPFVMNNFLDMDIELFKKIFKKECKKIGKPTRQTIPYFLGIIAINTKDPIRQKWGYQTIINFIQKKDNLKLLNFLYNISFKDVINKSNIKYSPKTC